MTNRIDHSACDHHPTPAARKACRDAIRSGAKATPVIDYVARDMHRNLTAYTIKARMDRRVIDSIPAETAAYLATAPRSPEPTTIAGDHCQACGSTDSENLNNGDQGYTACCNERVIMNFGSPCTSADCYHN
jgi:hypothetical protein